MTTHDSADSSARTSLAPGFIAAMPQLTDPNFRRTVVMILRHNDEGTFGLVINRPTDVTVGDLCENQGIVYTGPEATPMMFGGPVEVERHLLVLHGNGRCLPEDCGDEVEIAEGVILVTARTGLEILASRESARFRCYAGYAGWAPGQLEEEMRAGAWVPLACSDDLIFDEPSARVWEMALRRTGIDPITLVPGGEPA